MLIKLREDAQVAATLAFYRDNAREYVRETVDVDGIAPMRRRFVELLAANSLILDLGCGSGRDSKFFLELGHQVVAIDPVKEIAACAAQYLQQPVFIKKAEEIDEQNIYDGIWACASLLHIPKSRIAEALSRIAHALKPWGSWYMSFKQGEREEQDQRQRFFNNYSLAAMRNLLDGLPQLQIIDLSESRSTLRGEQQTWINVLVTTSEETAIL